METKIDYFDSKKGGSWLKTLKGSGLMAAALTLMHGLYLAFYFLWVFVLILAGLQRLAPPVLNPLALTALDTVVYLFLGVGMLRGRRSYFVYSTMWTLWGALLATFAATYKGSVLDLLSFLIVFFCVHYHVSVNRINNEVAKKLGQFAGGLALLQGMIVTFAFALPLMTVLPPSGPSSVVPAFVAVVVTAAVYIVSGVGMLVGREEFFFLAILWALTESVLAIAYSFYMYTHFHAISIFMVAFATYYYSAKHKKSR